MALVVKDRVRETSTSSGTGDLILNGAVQAFQDFSVIGDGNTTYYTIVDATTGAWEVGIGTYTLSTTTLSRDIVLESSDGGTAINFAANTKDVFVTYPAERSVYVDGVNITPADPTVTTGAIFIPSGTTAQRPDPAVGGMFRFNAELGVFEGYDGVEWLSLSAGSELQGDLELQSGTEDLLVGTGSFDLNA